MAWVSTGIKTTLPAAFRESGFREEKNEVVFKLMY
jgi:hypothetical protein